MTEEERERCIAHQHASHFSEYKYLSNEIDGMIVDIGTDIDWTVKTFLEPRYVKASRQAVFTITRFFVT